MKIWKTLMLKEQDKEINLIAKSLTNYLYKKGPISDLTRKYNITREDRELLDEYTSNRISGILMLYVANNKDRINDIVNHYNTGNDNNKITPMLEGYIEK